MKRLILSAALLLSACTGEATPPVGEINATDAYVLTPLQGRDMTAGYLTVSTNGPTLRLVGASSPAAERIELHTHVDDGGVMRMRQVDGFDITPDAPLVMAPRGAHLMVFGLRDVPDADAITLTLEYADGTTQDVQAELRAR